MTNQEIKDDVYARLVRVLTEFEIDNRKANPTRWEEELYNMLVEIQNNWEYITGD